MLTYVYEYKRTKGAVRTIAGQTCCSAGSSALHSAAVGKWQKPTIALSIETTKSIDQDHEGRRRRSINESDNRNDYTTGDMSSVILGLSRTGHIPICSHSQNGGKETMKAAIYCRVSTEDQEREGTSLQTQLEACLNYCQGKGYDVSNRFSEVYSGLSLERPKLSELRELVRDGDIDVVVVYCIDRFSRDPTHGVILTQELEKYNVTLDGVIETVDSSELGKLISYIRGFAAKIEIEKFKERSMRGKKAMVREGKYPQGCGFGLYGYDWDIVNKKRLPNNFETRIVNRVFSMIAEGYTRTDIARKLNEQGIKTKGGDGRNWHRITIERIITNKAYIGITTFCGTALPEVTPPIVDKELFERANQSLGCTKELRKGRPKAPYLLTGYIVCGKCDKPLTGSCTRPPYRYYHCSETYRREYKGKSCEAHRIRADLIESVVWRKVKEALENPHLLMAQVRAMVENEQNQYNGVSLDKDIAKLKRKLKAYKPDERSLLSLFRHKEIDRDCLLDEINQIKKDREEDEQKLADLTHTKNGMADLVDTELKITEYCSTVTRNLSNCTFENKRLALGALGIKVVATPEHFEINGTLPLEVKDAMGAKAQLYP